MQDDIPHIGHSDISYFYLVFLISKGCRKGERQDPEKKKLSGVTYMPSSKHYNNQKPQRIAESESKRFPEEISKKGFIGRFMNSQVNG